MPALVDLSIDGPIATITLNRPQKRNALSPELIVDFHAALDALGDADGVRAVVITGNGSAFCAGMDLRGVLDDPAAMAEMLGGLSRGLHRLRMVPYPTIAKVNGAAVGGGCGLAIVPDFTIAAESATMGYPEVDLGVCPAVVAPWLIMRIGAGPARAMLLEGGTMTATDAYARGLVTTVVPPESLDREVLDLANRLVTGEATAMAVTKQWLNELDGSMEEDVFECAATVSAEVIAGEEAQTRLGRLYGSSGT
jgi:methylglutaconyl-CoA hydratase